MIGVSRVRLIINFSQLTLPFKKFCGPRWYAVRVLAITGAAAPLARAQSIECIKPGRTASGCKVQIEGNDASQLIVVRILNAKGDPIPANPVTFSSSIGAITATAKADSSGIAAADFKQTGLTANATIRVSTVVAGIQLTDSVVVLPKLANPPTSWRLRAIPGGRPAWYVQRQLPGRMAVEIIGADATQCPNARIKFRNVTEGGAVAPDTAGAMWEQRNGLPGCYADTRWRLGNEIGEHVMQAELVGEFSKRVQFSAIGRALPRTWYFPLSA